MNEEVGLSGQLVASAGRVAIDPERFAVGGGTYGVPVAQVANDGGGVGGLVAVKEACVGHGVFAAVLDGHACEAFAACVEQLGVGVDALAALSAAGGWVAQVVVAVAFDGVGAAEQANGLRVEVEEALA